MQPYKIIQLGTVQIFVPQYQYLWMPWHPVQFFWSARGALVQSSFWSVRVLAWCAPSPSLWLPGADDPPRPCAPSATLPRAAPVPPSHAGCWGSPDAPCAPQWSDDEPGCAGAPSEHFSDMQQWPADCVPHALATGNKQTRKTFTYKTVPLLQTKNHLYCQKKKQRKRKEKCLLLEWKLV